MQSETELFNHVSVMKVRRRSMELYMSSWRSGILFLMLRALRRVAGRSREVRRCHVFLDVLGFCESPTAYIFEADD